MRGKMRGLILVLCFLSQAAFAAVKVSTYTVNTDVLTGTGTITIKIPGTFATTDSTAATFSGRQLVKIGLWLEGRAAGDMITAMSIKDIDGVVVAPGTVLGSLIDNTVASGNRGLALPPGNLPFQLDFPPGNAKAKLASGLYLVITFQKAIVGVDAAVVNLAWDDFT